MARGDPPSAGRATGAERPPPRLRTLEESLRADRQDGAGGSGRRRGLVVAGGLASPARSSARKSISATDGSVLPSPVSARCQESHFAIPLSKKYGGVMSQNSFQELPPVHPICASPSIRSRQPVPVDEVYDSAQIPSRERIGYPPEIAKRQKLRLKQWRHPFCASVR